MPTYVIVTELEFDNLLKHEKGWSKKIEGGEYVYHYVSKKNPDVVVKVFSSVTPNGVSRKCGGDAIRICAVNTKTNRGILKTGRVNRTAGWNERAKEKVIETINKIW
jgi:Na+-translocating ferredoxin:NAD+ oxidoreductase RnfG subunit